MCMMYGAEQKNDTGKISACYTPDNGGVNNEVTSCPDLVSGNESTSGAT